jgi:IclR family transcriptional regulator, pca regulon regulatory protein
MHDQGPEASSRGIVMSDQTLAKKQTKRRKPSNATPTLPVTAPMDTDRPLAEMIARHQDDPDFVTALARGIAVMHTMALKKRRMSMAQISLSTGIPRAAVRRSLHTLSKIGFVGADEAGQFQLRPRVLTFSHAYLSTSPLAVLAQPILDRLGDKVQESCSLAILDDDEIVYLARSTSSRIMSPSLNVGRRSPAYCTSIGHVLLAGMPPSELDAYLARIRFHRYTEHTVASAEQLRGILATVSEEGVAFTSQQIEARLCTLAVPVYDSHGVLVAGINIILQGRLLTADKMAAKFAGPLQEAATQLGALLL